jgi:hypothetical protein
MMLEDSAQGLFLEGNRELAEGNLAAAEVAYLRALHVDAEHGGAWANLGWLAERRGELADAERHYRHALALAPGNVRLQLNLSQLLLKLKQFEEAEGLARHATALAPASAEAWNQLGVVLACLKREEEAERCYRQSLAVVDDAAHAARTRFNLAYLLLRQGRWTEGWPMLQARWQFERLPEWFDCPRWQGEPLAGKALAIGLEAGQGDMIQFCRYAALAREQGAARVAVVCHPSLKTLFGTLPGVDAVYAYDEAVPRDGWDFWTLPMAMPQWFGTQPGNVPADVPYLSADPALVRHWRERMREQLQSQPRSPQGSDAAPAPLRVGLAWKGNPQFENDGERSLPSLHTLAPVMEAAAQRGIQLVCLQKGPGEDEAGELQAGQRAALQPPPLNLGPQLRDFADTAAVIASLDLVISIDSAVAHLAGALDKPCWLLLPDYQCDWRWLAEGERTPWYPSLRLFRQPRGGGWAPVAAALATAILHSIP